MLEIVRLRGWLDDASLEVALDVLEERGRDAFHEWISEVIGQHYPPLQLPPASGFRLMSLEEIRDRMHHELIERGMEAIPGSALESMVNMMAQQTHDNERDLMEVLDSLSLSK